MMKKVLTVLAALGVCFTSNAQRTAEDYYNDGMKYAQRANYKEAIAYFDMSIRLKTDDYFTWHNRGIAKSLMGDYTAAIVDFKQVVTLSPDYLKAWIALGNCYKRLTYYDSAINNYSFALLLDTENTEAYYHRAAVYEAMNMTDSAMADYKKLDKLGVDVKDKIKYYSDTAKTRPKVHKITSLTKTAEDPLYGFDSKKPVKVGAGPNGGFANVKSYLALLKDHKKRPVRYQRIKACCPHKAPGFSGNVLLEEYEVFYTDATGKEVATKMYFSYFEYDEPKIPVGLNGTK